jgi:hypothetical protein
VESHRLFHQTRAQASGRGLDGGASLAELESDFLRSAEVERVDSAAPSPPGPDLAASSARPMIEAYVHAIVDTCTRPREEIVAR